MGKQITIKDGQEYVLLKKEADEIVVTGHGMRVVIVNMLINALVECCAGLPDEGKDKIAEIFRQQLLREGNKKMPC